MPVTCHKSESSSDQRYDQLDRLTGGAWAVQMYYGMYRWYNPHMHIISPSLGIWCPGGLHHHGRLTWFVVTDYQTFAKERATNLGNILNCFPFLINSLCS